MQYRSSRYCHVEVPSDATIHTVSTQYGGYLAVVSVIYLVSSVQVQSDNGRHSECPWTRLHVVGAAETITTPHHHHPVIAGRFFHRKYYEYRTVLCNLDQSSY